MISYNNHFKVVMGDDLTWRIYVNDTWLPTADPILSLNKALDVIRVIGHVFVNEWLMSDEYKASLLNGEFAL